MNDITNTMNIFQIFSYLTVMAGLDHLPGLRVNIIAVQLIGQGVVSSTSKYIQVPVKGNHSVSIAPLRRWRGAPQQMFGWYTCPPENMGVMSVG